MAIVEIDRSQKPHIARSANGSVATIKPSQGVGPKGDTGDTGPQGIQGDQGDQGPTGDTGDQGLPGPGAAAWTAAQAVTTGSVRQAPDGSWIKSTTNRTTGATFDVTEQGFWTPTFATAGTLEEAALTASIESQLNEALVDFDPGVSPEELAAAVATYTATPTLPLEPVLLGSLTDSRLNTMTGLAVSTDLRYLYITVASANRFLIVDILDPLNPVVVASLVDATNMPSPYRIAVTGNYAVITCNQRIAVVNCTNPLAPTVASTSSYSDLGNIGGGHIALSADGNTAYQSYPSGNRVSIVNITTKTAPTHVATLQDNTNLAGASAIQVLSTSRVAFACTGSDSITIINVGTPATPVYVTKATGVTLDGAQLMVKDGRYLGVLTSSAQFTVVDIDTIDSPVIKGSVTSGLMVGISAITLVGHLVIGTTTTGGVFRVDMTDPNAPVMPDAARSLEAEEVFGQSTSVRALMAQAGTRLIVSAPDLDRLNIFGRGADGQPRRASVAMIGDSLTRINGSGTQRNSTRGFVTWANIKHGQKWRLIHNGGSDGRTSAQILACAWTDLTLYRPGVAHIIAGTNDIGISTTADQVIANVRTLVRLALASGSRVVVGTVPALVISSDVGGLKRAKLNAINTGIRALAAATDGVTLADYYAAWDNGSGEPITGYAYDGLHPTALGASIWGEVFYNAVETAAAGAFLAAGRILNPTNQAPNPTLTGTAGTAGTGASGTIADSTTITQAVASKPTSTSQRLVIGASVTSTAVQTATVTAGDIIVGEVTLDAATFAAVTRMNLKLVAGARTTYDLSPLVAATVTDDSITNPIPSPGSGVTLRTFPIVVPTGTTTADLTVTITTGASGSADYTIKSFKVASVVIA